MIQRLIFINLFSRVNFRIIKVRHIAETITFAEVAVSKVYLPLVEGSKIIVLLLKKVLLLNVEYIILE